MSASTFTFSAALVGGARVQSKVRERRVKLNRRDDDERRGGARSATAGRGTTESRDAVDDGWGRGDGGRRGRERDD